jgi:hypothetical protein
VAFFDGPPGPSNRAFAVASTRRALQPGEAELVSVEWRNPPPGPRTVHVVADDDGAGVGAHSECDRDQPNTATIPGLGCP